jgi:hypothetical protein
MPSHEEHAEHGDDHRGAGEEHGPAGGADGRHRGLLGVLAVAQALAVPGDDEQRVVDPHADADHGGDDGREVRHVEDVGQQLHDGQADADAHHRDQDGQAHGQHGAEGDEQDQHGDEDAEALGSAALDELGPGDGLAAELEADTVAVGGLGGLDHLFGHVDGHVAALDVELERAEGDPAVLGDIAGPLGRVGAEDAHHVLERPQLLEQALDPLADGGVADVPIGLVDDGDGVARPLGELLLEDLEGLGRLGPRDVEVGAVLPGRRGPEDAHQDEPDDPAHQDEPAPPKAEPGQIVEHRSSLPLGQRVTD